MGMSTHIKAFIPDTDPEFKKHKEILDICLKHNVYLPAQTAQYFGQSNPYEGMADEKLEKELTQGIHYVEYRDSHSSEEGFDVDLTKLPTGVTKLRFYNSW